MQKYLNTIIAALFLSFLVNIVLLNEWLGFNEEIFLIISFICFFVSCYWILNQLLITFLNNSIAELRSQFLDLCFSYFDLLNLVDQYLSLVQRVVRDLTNLLSNVNKYYYYYCKLSCYDFIFFFLNYFGIDLFFQEKYYKYFDDYSVPYSYYGWYHYEELYFLDRFLESRDLITRFELCSLIYSDQFLLGDPSLFSQDESNLYFCSFNNFFARLNLKINRLCCARLENDVALTNLVYNGIFCNLVMLENKVAVYQRIFKKEYIFQYGWDHLLLFGKFDDSACQNNFSDRDDFIKNEKSPLL